MNTPDLEKENVFRVFCNMIRKSHIWAINLGEVRMSDAQCNLLIDTIRDSMVSFMFVDAVLVGKDVVRTLKDIIRDRRRTTSQARWIIGDDHAQNNVILRCRNMWFGPCSLGRNKHRLEKMRLRQYVF